MDLEATAGGEDVRGGGQCVEGVRSVEPDVYAQYYNQDGNPAGAISLTNVVPAAVPSVTQTSRLAVPSSAPK